MKQALIVHGAYGNPNENWIPWLKTNLENTGYVVVTPTFPTPENQKLDNWGKIVEKYINQFDKETVLIGHSIGAAFLMSVLEKLATPVNKTILISAFLDSLDNPDFDTLNESFIKKDFDWDKIRVNSKSFAVFHGEDDPYVPLSKANRVGSLLKVPVSIIPNGGHLNESAGFTEFPELLKEIL